MTYLFNNCSNYSDERTLEVAIDSDNGFLGVVIKEGGSLDDSKGIHLTQKDVYHLIGALHLIQKEMKEDYNG